MFQDVFIDVFEELFEKRVEMRNNYFPSDPAYITQQMKSSYVCQAELADMRNQLLKMREDMKESAPFFSPRYQAHMNWGTTMPSLLGYTVTWLPCSSAKTTWPLQAVIVRAKSWSATVRNVGLQHTQR